MAVSSKDFSADPKFTSFSATDVTYKTVGTTAVEATILVPKTIIDKPGKYPLAIRWHGGFWVTGHRLFPDWYPTWLLDFCFKHDAIAIAPDYRLVPEANGQDILQDMRDFYTWLLEPGNLSKHLPSGVEANLGNLLVTGESAGGWLAWQSAIYTPKSIGATVLHYPVLDLRAPHFTVAGPKELFPGAPAELPSHILNDYVAKLKGDEVVGNDENLSRFPLVLSIVQQGRFDELFGTDRSLHPLEQVEDGAVTSEFPSIWILHGKDDTAVPIEGTRKMVEALQQRGLGEDKLHLSVEAGGHGFDIHAPDTNEAATLETGWVKEGVSFLMRSAINTARG
ncbi:hypothetical protein LTR78_009806 [Recurvomyces mirabilis]|uniref:Alpha/beta hydrolase fold-3 domain-containing protein n=1 Tax=Recurvomyces mirabilis TaxID=574656 RepID=A0AAE0TNC4_9PEZI|nr:hypothetical protein LTR78_009806 [Recurvomyces mirabilis]KAK5158223.1 hypothetical protein LTS14_003241 [Recurvomyces mirabilis]